MCQVLICLLFVMCLVAVFVFYLICVLLFWDVVILFGLQVTWSGYCGSGVYKNLKYKKSGDGEGFEIHHL